MSVGPVSGNGIPITLVAGKTVFWSVFAQAAWNQFVQLKDSRGNVVFTTAGASPGGHSPTQIGQSTFVVADQSGSYTLFIGINGGSAWQQVLWDQMDINLGANVYLSTYTFISEDGADQDYNDSCVTLSWFRSIG